MTTLQILSIWLVAYFIAIYIFGFKCVMLVTVIYGGMLTFGIFIGYSALTLFKLFI